MSGFDSTAKSTPLDPQVFSTRHLNRADRFDAWRQMLSDLVDLEPADEPVSDFPADAEHWQLGPLTFSRFTLGAAPARSWRHRPRAHRDDWCVVLTEKAGFRSPGALSFRSLAMPYEGRGRDELVFTLLLPRGCPAAETHALDLAHGREVAPPMAEMLATYMHALARNLPGMSQAQAEALAEPTRLLVAACAGWTRAPLEPAAASLSGVVLERARSIVRRNISSPDFGPAHLCRQLAVSRSKLYRLFEHTGGVAAFIQRERLQKAMQCLNDCSDTRSVSGIAADLGFVDHSTFSRAFRREYGISPREARNMALVRQGATPAGPDPALSSHGHA